MGLTTKMPKVRGGYDDIMPDHAVFIQVNYTRYNKTDHQNNYYGRPVWRCGWKTYTFLWSALRYGTEWLHHDCPFYVKNMGTGEIVHKSWEDEHPYR